MRRLLLPLLLLLGAPLAGARGGETPVPDPAAAGRAVFARSVRWIRGTDGAIGRIRTAHLVFRDVKLDDDEASGRHHEGHLELWFAAPDRFRETWRLSLGERRPTVRVLDGLRGWIRTAGSRTWRRQHGAGGTGAAAIRQMRRDARQLADLARFLAPAALDGPDVTWRLEGAQRLLQPLADAKGPALVRVRRSRAGEATMLFFFAPGAAAPGVAAGPHPAVVGIQGDPRKGQRRAWYRLDRWRRTPAGRARPGRIQGFAPKANGAGLRRFLLLHPHRLAFNVALPAGVFEPRPLAPAPPGAKGHK